jgi:uncharacterized protein with PIN domain
MLCRGQKLGFVVDAMLGRLAKWLRILGYDTLYDPSWDDAYLVRLARAEDRFLLTRDLQLTRRKGVRVVWIASESLEEQLDQLHADLGVAAIAPWTRCPVCNSALVSVPKGDAWGQVPPYVFVTQEEFRLCPHCNRFYWRGTHRQHMETLVTRWAGDIKL